MNRWSSIFSPRVEATSLHWLLPALLSLDLVVLLSYYLIFHVSVLEYLEAVGVLILSETYTYTTILAMEMFFASAKNGSLFATKSV